MRRNRPGPLVWLVSDKVRPRQVGHWDHDNPGLALGESSNTGWATVDTRLLTQRGLLNRDSESFGEIVWGAVATVMVAFAAQRALALGALR
jgi:hypothetical protein